VPNSFSKIKARNTIKVFGVELLSLYCGQFGAAECVSKVMMQIGKKANTNHLRIMRGVFIGKSNDCKCLPDSVL
jgi:hypothetical protein